MGEHAGPWLSSRQVKHHLGVTQEELMELLSKGELVGDTLGAGLFPRRQFTAKSVVANLSSVVRELKLKGYRSGEQGRWLSHQSSEHGGRTPWELLHEGELQQVLGLLKA